MEAQRNIVIVDDDIVALDIVSFLFEERGYNVHRCADGASAVEAVNALSPDLLLIDLMMPGINGVSAIKDIRSDGHKDMPIIAFTAIDDPQIHEDALAAGCNVVLTKPCSTEKLTSAVKSLLQS